MYRRGFIFITLCLGLGLSMAPLYSEDKKPAPEESKVDAALPKQIDAAIEKGRDYLIKEFNKNPGPLEYGEGERVFYLYALFHAGLTEKQLKSLPIDILTVKEINKNQKNGMAMAWAPSLIYSIPARLIALTLLDPVKYQEQIADYAQWLIDNQTADGQWGYPMDYSVNRPALRQKGTVTPSGKEGGLDKLPSIKLTRNQAAANGGDSNNSCSQFALLGLLAATQAKIEIPKEVWERSLRFWLQAQQKDGGWSYWGAVKMIAGDGSSYGSMTCAGISSLVICLRQLGKDVKKEGAIQRGIEWLKQNFSVTENPLIKNSRLWTGYSNNGKVKVCLYYYLYSLERAATLAEADSFGNHNWYKEGAEYLLKHQDADGGWSDKDAGGDSLEPTALRTCYAILFLKRATKAYITPSGWGKAIITPSAAEAPKTPPAAEPPVTTTPSAPLTPMVVAAVPAPPASAGAIVITLTGGVVLRGKSLTYHKGDFLLETTEGIKVIPCKDIVNIEYQR